MGWHTLFHNEQHRTDPPVGVATSSIIKTIANQKDVTETNDCKKTPP